MLDTLSIIVNTAVSVISAIIDFAAVPLSAASVFILVVDRHEKKESEKMKLIVTPKRKYANKQTGMLYLYLSFSNESSLPISVLDMRLMACDDYSDNFTKYDVAQGTVSVESMEMIPTNRRGKPIPDTNVKKTSPIPIVIPPYGAYGGYFGFYFNKEDAFILCHKDVRLEIITSRKSYKIEMNLNAANFYETSYRDDGLVFGKSVIGTLYVDTTIKSL